jgi:periplasmic divalent cation tolerance protein
MVWGSGRKACAAANFRQIEFSLSVLMYGGVAEATRPFVSPPVGDCVCSRPMFIAWTTVATALDAEHLADGAIAQNLAVCAQVEGPIHSHYVWQGRKTATAEWRITFKLLPEQSAPLSAYVHAAHPYETPQWLVVEAVRVGEKYLSWARAPRSSVNL